MNSSSEQNPSVVSTPEHSTSAGKSQEGRVCAKCGDPKPRSEFYRKQKDKPWLDCYCKECRREHVRQWRQDNRKRYRTLQQRNYTTEKNTCWQARHRARYPERVFARARIRVAKNNGLILDHCTWPNCAEKDRIQAHHPSYDRPYEIVSLCRLHHKAADFLNDKLGFDLPIIDISGYFKKDKASLHGNGEVLHADPPRAFKPFHAGRVDKTITRVDAGGTLFPTPLVCAGAPRVRHDSRSTDPGAKSKVTT